MYQETPWVIIPEKIDRMHIMPTSDHIFWYIIHVLSKSMYACNK